MAIFFLIIKLFEGLVKLINIYWYLVLFSTILIIVITLYILKKCFTSCCSFKFFFSSRQEQNLENKENNPELMKLNKK